jgi:hypothetical protein
MNYKNLETALKETFKYDGFNQYFGLNFDLIDFEDSFGLSNKAICISYNGVEPSGDMEAFNYLMNESISIFVKYQGTFEDFHDILKTLIKGSRTTFTIADDNYTMEFQNMTINDSKDYLVGILNYGAVSLW